MGNLKSLGTKTVGAMVNDYALIHKLSVGTVHTLGSLLGVIIDIDMVSVPSLYYQLPGDNDIAVGIRAVTKGGVLRMPMQARIEFKHVGELEKAFSGLCSEALMLEE